MSTLESTVFTYDSPEPTEQTVIAIRLLDWGVAFKRAVDGHWYGVGRGRSSAPMDWGTVLDAIEGEDAFVIGPDHSPVDI